MSRERLTTWPEIAAYIGRDTRTAKRYEIRRNLPVRRVPGGGKAPVYAFRDELDAWLARGSDGYPLSEPVGSPLSPPPVQTAPGRRPIVRRGAAAAVVGLFATVALVGVIAFPRPAPARVPNPRAVALNAAGRYAWQRRTPEGLRRAVDAFTQAAVIDPTYAPAYVGLADSYNLSPEFGTLPPQDAYPRAMAASERALALDPGSAAAHRALAFGEFWWAQDVSAAFREFHTALRLDPRSALTHHWYATALAERGDPAALSEIDTAAALEPTTAVMADKGWMLIVLGRLDEAQSVLTQVAALDPAYATVHRHLAFLHERRGEDAEMLREDATVAALDHKPLDALKIAHARAALARGGHLAMLRVLAHEDQGSLVHIASLRSRLHELTPTLQLLKAARRTRDPGLLGVLTSPDFAWLRSDPRFQSVALMN